MGDLSFHLSCRFLVLRRHGLWTRLPTLSAGDPWPSSRPTHEDCMSQVALRGWDWQCHWGTWTPASEDNLSSFHSMKKYHDQCLLRPPWKSCVSRGSGIELQVAARGGGGEQLSVDISWVLILCQALPCVHYLCDSPKSPTEKSNNIDLISVRGTLSTEKTGAKIWTQAVQFLSPRSLTTHHSCLLNWKVFMSTVWQYT